VGRSSSGGDLKLAGIDHGLGQVNLAEIGKLLRSNANGKGMS
jgi:hypothetical protein